MRRAGVVPRLGQGFPRAYGPGHPSEPAPIRHGYLPEPRPMAAPEFRLLLTGNPMSDPRPRGPWVSGPPPGFPPPAVTGTRLDGGQGTDLYLQQTWQRQYQFTA